MNNAMKSELNLFVSFTTKKATTFTLNTESTYDWHNSQWTVPHNLMVGQMLKIGKLLWPAVVVHGILTVLLARAWFMHLTMPTKTTRTEETTSDE